jgi:hypothetical protein
VGAFVHGSRAPWLAGLLAAAALLLAAGKARAGEVVVVAHPELPVDQLTLAELKRIYVGEKTFLGGIKLEPLDYAHPCAAADTFFEAVMGMDPPHFHGWWVKQVFHGGGIPPLMLDDAAAVLRMVASEPGAIGFVPAEDLKGVTTVKRLLSLPAP